MSCVGHPGTGRPRTGCLGQLGRPGRLGRLGGRVSVWATRRPGSSAGRALALGEEVWSPFNIRCHVLGCGMCRLSWDTYVRNACILHGALLHVGLVPLGSYPALGPGVLDPEGGLVGGYLFMGCRSSYNKWRPWQGRRYAHSHWGIALRHGAEEAACTEKHGCVNRS